MIDITTEKLLSMSQAARLIPPSRSGRATHTSTLVRWIHRGVRGRRLDAVRIGGSWVTSVEALARFAVPAASTAIVDIPVTRSPSAARAARVNAELVAHGI
jgi:Protein of unknown function (DUF1580)